MYVIFALISNVNIYKSLQHHYFNALRYSSDPFPAWSVFYFICDLLHPRPPPHPTGVGISLFYVSS
jgi:hypothetical protein